MYFFSILSYSFFFRPKSGVSIDFYRLIDSIDNDIALSILSTYRLVFDIDFYRLPTPGNREMLTVLQMTSSV